MTSAPHRIFCWRKVASSKWADAWEERICGAVGGGRVAFVSKGPEAKLLFITAYNLTRGEATFLKQHFGGMTQPQKDLDWVAATSQRRAPIRIRKALIVSDQPAPNKEKSRMWLQIGASAAFGTGEHATTAMCLRFLADYPPRGAKVLDAGCGTAILGLAALRLGGVFSLAIDNDPLAVRVARQNARLNGLSNVINIRLGTVSDDILGGETFDLICANLFAGALEKLFPLFHSRLALGGRLIFSGVLRSQEEQVAQTARAAKFELIETRRHGKWIAVLARPRIEKKPSNTAFT